MIQILRGSRDKIKNSDKTLASGQMLYNSTDNYISVGSSSGTGTLSPLTKEPIAVKELHGNVDTFKDDTTSYDYSIKHDGNNLNITNTINKINLISKSEVTVSQAPTSNIGVVRKLELAAETSARETADTNEKTAREKGDNDEKAARQSADNDLQAAINAETSRATTEEAKKVNKLSTNTQVYAVSRNGENIGITFDEYNATPSSIARRKPTSGALVVGDAENNNESVNLGQLKNFVAVPFTDLTQLSTALGHKIIYVGGDRDTADTLYQNFAQLTINSGIYHIDFNGATINVTQWDANITSSAYNWLLKGHEHCVITNLNLNVTIRPRSSSTSNVLYSILTSFGGITNTKISVTIQDPSTLSAVATTVEGLTSCDHITNTKITITNSSSKGTVYCHGYAYCNDLVWARAEVTKKNSSNDKAYIHCNKLVNCNDYVGNFTTDAESCNEIISGMSGTNDSQTFFSKMSTLNVTGRITTAKLTLGDVSLDAFNTVQSSTISKAYVSPKGGKGIALIDINNAISNNSIARRTSTGTLQASDGVSDKDVATIGQIKNSGYYIYQIYGKIQIDSTNYWIEFTVLSKNGSLVYDESITINIQNLYESMYKGESVFLSGQITNVSTTNHQPIIFMTPQSTAVSGINKYVVDMGVWKSTANSDSQQIYYLSSSIKYYSNTNYIGTTNSYSGYLKAYKSDKLNITL